MEIQRVSEKPTAIETFDVLERLKDNLTDDVLPEVHKNLDAIRADAATKLSE